MLDRLIASLQVEKAAHGENHVARFESLLARIAALNDPASICALVGLFDDDAPFDEMMFSIVHTIERFDDATYVREIARSLPAFWLKSPRWAPIVHMRIMNSAHAFGAYLQLAQDLTPEQRDAARAILQSIRTKDRTRDANCELVLSKL
jgi:hypothetical protein